jgi:hypothetical protein
VVGMLGVEATLQKIGVQLGWWGSRISGVLMR